MASHWQWHCTLVLQYSVMCCTNTTDSVPHTTAQHVQYTYTVDGTITNTIPILSTVWQFFTSAGYKSNHDSDNWQSVTYLGSPWNWLIGHQYPSSRIRTRNRTDSDSLLRIRPASSAIYLSSNLCRKLKMAARRGGLAREPITCNAYAHMQPIRLMRMCAVSHNAFCTLLYTSLL